eukprot:gene15027-17774_t
MPSPMNEDGDDEDIVNTPPTPPLASTPPMYHSNTSFLSNRTTSSMNDPLSHALNLAPSIHGTEPNEYESLTKIRRTSTQTINYDSEMSKMPEFNADISFLHSQTQQINDEEERTRSSSNLSQPQLLSIDYAGTNTEKIAQEYYQTFMTRYSQRNDRFTRAREEQCRVIRENDINGARNLNEQYNNMKAEVDQERKELSDLLSSTILQPNDLLIIRETFEGLKTHFLVIDVLSQELKYIIDGKQPECCANIIIKAQPPAEAIFRGKTVSKPYVVQLVSGVIQPENVSRVTIRLDVKKEKKEKGADAKQLENYEQDFDNKYTATFTSLNIPGAFAVAYVTNDESEKVKHYLVKPEDIGANKTLPDFLRERSLFKTLYTLDPPKKILTPVAKADAFQVFNNKRITKTQQAINPGYVQDV